MLNTMTANDARRLMLAHVRAETDDLLNEVAARYMDADSHALIAEIRQRLGERIASLTPERDA